MTPTQRVRVQLGAAVVLSWLCLFTPAEVFAQYSIVHAFTAAADGAAPRSTLTLSGSTVYGTTLFDGAGRNGTIFKMNADGSGFATLHSFSNAEGAQAYGGVTVVGDTLFGTTSVFPSTANRGALFSMKTDGTNYQTIRAFQGLAGNDGEQSRANLTVVGSKLIGSTMEGGVGGFGGAGTIFSLNTDGTGYQRVRAFNGSPNDGDGPVAAVTANGSVVYGTTQNGGTSQNGVVFSMNADGTNYQLVHKFVGSDGGHPASSVTLVGSTLYGTTSYGGTNGGGVVFSVNTDGTGYQVLHNFANNTLDGGNPSAGLTLVDSTLYGTTAAGGLFNLGTAFAINTDGSGYRLVHQFRGGATDGYTPGTDLLHVGRNLLGGTLGGGPTGRGVIFAIAVPEPSSFVLAAAGLAGLLTAWARRRWAQRG